MHMFVYMGLPISVDQFNTLTGNGTGNGNGNENGTATATATDYFAPLSILYNIFALIYVHGIGIGIVSVAMDFELFASSFL